MPRTKPLKLQFAKALTLAQREAARQMAQGLDGRWWADVSVSPEGKTMLSLTGGAKPRGR